MNNRLVSYLGEKFQNGNLHKGFSITLLLSHLLWDPILNKHGMTVFYSVQRVYIGSNLFFQNNYSKLTIRLNH